MASTISEALIEKIESSRYVVLGNVDAGKSTLIAVLEKDTLDNGNGSARSLIFKMKHEKESGRTSTHSSYYIINQNEITTLVDLCGHEKYLKTTLFGVMGLFCDYGIVTVGSNMGIVGMTYEHFGLLISNKIPFIVIFTKIDLCPKNVMANVKKDLERIAKRNKKQIIYFETAEEKVNGSYIKDSHRVIIDAFHDRKTTLMPVIMASNKTGFNIGFIKELLTTIKSQNYLEKMNMAPEPKPMNYPPVLYIDNTYTITGIGIVLSGTLKYGSMSLGQKALLGPINNQYINITIKSLHNCISENIEVLHENESGSIGIRLETKGSYTRSMFSKGQIVTTDLEFAMKHTCQTFNCDVAIFNHPTTIKNGYQTVIHCGTIRQSGKFIMDDQAVLRTNSRATLDIKFILKAEFMLSGTYFMFRDDRTKGMGRVNSCIPLSEDTPEAKTKVKQSTTGSAVGPYSKVVVV